MSKDIDNINKNKVDVFIVFQIILNPFKSYTV